MYSDKYNNIYHRTIKILLMLSQVHISTSDVANNGKDPKFEVGV